MLHTLLLQTTTHTTTVETASLTNVYIAMGATLGAALVAAAASIFATFRTTKTAGKVADLSAQVTRESSTLAARTAQELKDKDYKNDYYKRIIDKRIKALEYAESAAGLFRVYKTHKEGHFHRYFLDNKDDKVYRNSINIVIDYTLWYNFETLNSIKEFHNEMVLIFDSIRGKELEEIIPFISSKFDTIREKRDKVLDCIGKDMHTLYDIDLFLHSRFGENTRG